MLGTSELEGALSAGQCCVAQSRVGVGWEVATRGGVVSEVLARCLAGVSARAPISFVAK